MFIGETASKHLNPKEPMQFEDATFRRTLFRSHVITRLKKPQKSTAELQPTTRSVNESKVDTNSGDQDYDASPSASNLAAEHEPEENDDLLPDYTAGLESCDSDDDTDDSSESSLTAYDLDDDRTDLSQSKRPKYLRDATKALDNKDDYEVGTQKHVHTTVLCMWVRRTVFYHTFRWWFKRLVPSKI